MPADAPALVNRPELWFENVEYLDAFFVLTHSRPMGMGVGPIPISEIHAYCQLFDVPDPRLLFRRVRECDRVFLADHLRKQDTQRRAAEAKAKAGSSRGH